MAKNIIMHNPFEDIPDFRDKKDDKKIGKLILMEPMY